MVKVFPDRNIGVIVNRKLQSVEMESLQRRRFTNFNDQDAMVSDRGHEFGELWVGPEIRLIYDVGGVTTPLD